MKIEWKLDEEGGIDPIDPVGDIVISDGDRTIQEESTYLDSWFDALITGAKNITSVNSLVIDIAEEPHALRLTQVLQGLQISYKDKTIWVAELDEFIKTLKQSATSFILKFNKKEMDKNELLDKIRDFVDFKQKQIC
ncbi:MAG: hypothetical protein RIE73_31175 [Coleofasciculus sp. C1-SOL-03]|jgi:hypothetical protein|uniref:hypothetical protein n=1 Tax=Coleofasciculus sp. C1-SOL-03 TaxID=3069522 RepID=UPI003303A698